MSMDTVYIAGVVQGGRVTNTIAAFPADQGRIIDGDKRIGDPGEIIEYAIRDGYIRDAGEYWIFVPDGSSINGNRFEVEEVPTPRFRVKD